MNNPIKTSNRFESTSRKHCSLISALLGWLGAANSFLIGFFILTTCLAFSSVPPIEQLLFQAYLTTILTAVSALTLIYGSYLIWKTSTRKGGIINLLAGTLIPVPIYTYFTFLSKPTLLSWLGPIGCFLLAPAIISGIIGILTLK